MKKEEIVMGLYAMRLQGKNRVAQERNNTVDRAVELINQLDEPEVLSSDWIDKNKTSIDRKLDGTPIYKVREELLQNLLVPKQDKPVIPKFVIKRGPEAGGISVEELNRIINAKAHGYDEVPTVADKTEGVYVVKDGAEIAVGESTSISFEEAMTLVENDMIDQPPHYIGNQGLEVEVVLQNFIPRYEDPYVGHRVASAIEYLLRSPLKNQRQDIEKAGKNIQQALAYLDMTEE